MFKEEMQAMAKLNYRLLQAIDIMPSFWNAIGRFWFEQYGSLLAQSIYEFPGQKIWIQAPPFERTSYLCKIATLLADHVIVGHCGPLPPPHLGLAHPEVSYYPDQPPPGTVPQNNAYLGLLDIDGVRRPLPPTAFEYLMGELRLPLLEGCVSYFPASIIYSPSRNDPWPSPSSILKGPDTEITFTANDLIVDPGNKVLADFINPFTGKFEMNVVAGKSKAMERKMESQKNGQDLPTIKHIVTNRLNDYYRGDEKVSEKSLSYQPGDNGLLQFSDKRVGGTCWEWSQDAILWEQILAGILASGAFSSPRSIVSIERLPDAMFSLNVPCLTKCPWDAILEVKEQERDALFRFRQAIMKACSAVQEERGTALFKNAVENIQRSVIDGEVSELEKSFRELKKKQAGKILGFGLEFISLEIACYLGLQLPGALYAFGRSMNQAIKLRLNLREELAKWYKTSQDLPMYFLWWLSHHKKLHNRR